MITRRKVIVVLGVEALAPVASQAQQPGKIYRVGFLANGSRPVSLETSALVGFPKALREFGYFEGKNLSIEWRFSEGKKAQFESQATELVKMNVDVIVAATTTGTAAAQEATRTIPIVMVTTSNVVANGFVASLGRPGGNITGMSNLSEDVSVKYLELLRAAAPNLSRVAVWLSAENARNNAAYLTKIQYSAKVLGITVVPVEPRTPNEVDAALDALVKNGTGGIIVNPGAFNSIQARRIADFAIRRSLPTMFWTREHVEAGGLMSYGQNNAEHYRRAAHYVDKILKGAKPGDLPVEQAANLELVINRKTAKAIGLTLQVELLLRADMVIE